ncbi:type II toxin-antitoxin system death-on-curing family toxin [Ponticoccus sp. SC2-23]|nr:type II toxin-antitoxin system death-on-curing family toxin [Ponticoccus sp. SC6-9]MBM1227346.1 type II toxin-antitoxin system death-on-curing family toxin [Ponticoccus sp. SC6-15]MBM1231849.1 type II toxin-antitoxin system death-on-curing family toxin [Ponticoccus sp. SC6-38]MBM1236379.1 type II toxin-antitoxin system death-on-curing family toxin [Ponticoccus sp. SC6-45]MBM1240869.1 type II toxin-antitoxin system death-on-curing family toxin [Ponticoccus sp. SC6-49]MBM1245395.1 type II tox
MSEPRWMSRQDVEYLHHGVIEVGGGSHGLRDPALLDSALGRPKNQYSYGETDIFRLAAGYAEAISRNHPFVDGNKRTAFQTAYQFLKDNGYLLVQARGHEHAEAMEKLGQGHISREDMGQYLASHCREISQEQNQLGALKAKAQARRDKERQSPRPGHSKDRDV